MDDRSRSRAHRWSAGLLIAAGAGWLVIELLDLPTHLGWYGLGATPTGLRCALAGLVALSITVGAATRSLTAARPVLVLLVVAVLLRVAGRAIPLLGHDDHHLDTSASTSLISTGVVGATLAVTIALVVAAVVTRRTLSTAAMLVVIALVTMTVNGAGVPTGVREVTAGGVAAALTASGIIVLRRRRIPGRP